MISICFKYIFLQGELNEHVQTYLEFFVKFQNFAHWKLLICFEWRTRFHKIIWYPIVLLSQLFFCFALSAGPIHLYTWVDVWYVLVYVKIGTTHLELMRTILVNNPTLSPHSPDSRWQPIQGWTHSQSQHCLQTHLYDPRTLYKTSLLLRKYVLP